MAMGNVVTVVGNVTRDPELRYTPNGSSVASFGVAWNRRYERNGEQIEDVSFFDITCWASLADNVAASIRGKARTARSAARSKSPLTMSLPACAGHRQKSDATNAPTISVGVTAAAGTTAAAHLRVAHRRASLRAVSNRAHPRVAQHPSTTTTRSRSNGPEANAEQAP